MTDTPQIIIGGNAGYHNLSDVSVERVARGRQYRDLSTVCVIPATANIPPRVVESWWELLTPLNQRFQRVFVTGLEVRDAYNRAVMMILQHSVLSRYRYLLTLEHDNMSPPTGLLMLYENIDGFAAVGGLYWGKGEDGQPMIFGRPGATRMSGRAAAVRTRKGTRVMWAHLQDQLPDRRGLRSDLSEAFAKALLVALEKEPVHRRQSAGEYARRLAEAAAPE